MSEARDQDQFQGFQTMLGAWMKTAMETWTEMARNWAESAKDGRPPGPAGGFRSKRTEEYLKTTAQGYQALFKIISAPESMRNLMDGMTLSPRIMLKMAGAGWKGFLALQQQWMEKAAGLAARTETYKFEDLDRQTFQAWTEVYKEDIQGFFNVPTLGLARFYQERAGRLMDRLNLFQAALAEFLYLTFVPMEKSLKLIGQELETISKDGRVPEDFRHYYQKWIKALEGHYMVLFKSPEYLQTLSRTLEAFEEFLIARHKWLEDQIKTLPVPTQAEMDEVYKELYQLKKEVQALKKTRTEGSAEGR
ncbi:MAG: poly(R)-hydroxyalkanoic acid synthase subunit PhaE [Thermodesulfobacteriota bacterium]